MAEFVVADTTVVSRLTSHSADSAAYNEYIGDRLLAVSFQSEAELLGAKFGESRARRLRDLLATILVLPHSGATNARYAQIVERRRELKKKGFAGGDAQDADAWIISSALEHNLELLSHDVQQVHLGRAIGMGVFTDVMELRGGNPARGERQ